jgi:hypothetical protein
MFSNKKRRRIKPFARPTSFDFNAVYDLRHFQRVRYGPENDNSIYSRSTSIEDFQIMEGEILMQKNMAIQIRRYGDHQMHCFGFAAGLEGVDAKVVAGTTEGVVLLPADAAVENKISALKALQYAGVAVTGFKPETDIYEQGFVVTVAGLNTIFNNGEHDIYPGDLICADVPKADLRKLNRSNAQGGIPGTKYQFVVTPFRELAGETNTELASKFIMGTAMSFSKKGSPLDVVLHRCNVILYRQPEAELVGNPLLGDDDFNGMGAGVKQNTPDGQAPDGQDGYAGFAQTTKKKRSRKTKL